MFIKVPFFGFIALICLATSVLSTIIYTHNSNIYLLLFMISGYLVTVQCFIQIIILIFQSSISIGQEIVQTFFLIPIYLFHIVTGILNIIGLIHHDIKYLINHGLVIIPTLFIISIIPMSIMAFLTIASIFSAFEDNTVNPHKSFDLESQLTLNKNNSHAIDKFQTQEHPIIKKSSDHTLTEDKQEEFLSEPDLEYIMKRSTEQYNASDDYTENWMGSGSKLHSLQYPVPASESTLDLTISRSRKNTFMFNSTNKLFLRPTAGNPSLLYTRSVPNLWKVTSPKSPNLTKFNEFKERFMEKNFYKSSTSLNSSSNLVARRVSKVMTTSNSLSTIFTDASRGSDRDLKSRRVSLLTSNCLSENNISGLGAPLNNIIEKKDDSLPVKRSKSTSHIGNKRSKKREQRWMSINDEKIFLLNVNDSLLPSVLKSGESPIMEIKRQQERKMESPKSTPNLRFSPSTPNLEYGSKKVQDTPPFLNKQSFLSPVGEVSTCSETSPEFAEKVDEESFENLPYAGEFDMPVDDLDFEGFDQETAIVKDKFKSTASYSFKIPEQETEENYLAALNGLERIPRSKKVWIPKNENSHVNHISLQDWKENQENWAEHRVRSGVNLNIPGITKHISDHNLRSLQTDTEKLLLPPVDHRADNIDNLSDINTRSGSVDIDRQPSYSILSRSFSAPSLHTFRNVSDRSNSTKASEERDEFSLGNTLKSCITPTEKVSASSNGSPIRKLFHIESPKRLSNVFGRRKSDRRDGHKHSESLVSNQYSLTSAISSRSSSPKKSFKSLISKSYSMAPPKITTTDLTTTELLYTSSDPIDFWELETAPSSDKSRVSSVPSAVIGEYDREKWRTLKLLQNQELTGA